MEEEAFSRFQGRSLPDFQSIKDSLPSQLQETFVKFYSSDKDQSGNDQQTDPLLSTAQSVAATPEFIEPFLLLLFTKTEKSDGPHFLSISKFLRLCSYIAFQGHPEERVAQLKREGILISRMCTSVWGKRSIAYRCNTCGTSLSSSICVDCFQAGNHEGHNYCIYHSGFGGCCDCGNEEAWSKTGFCVNHRGRTNEDVLARFPPSLIATCTPVVSIVTKILLYLFVPDADRRGSVLGRTMEENSAKMQEAIIHWIRQFSNTGDAVRFITGKGCLKNLLSFKRVEPGDEELVVPWDSNGDKQIVWLQNLQRRFSVKPSPSTDDGLPSLLCGLGFNLPPDVADSLINLYLELLYDDNFKREFMMRFLSHYPSLVDNMMQIDKADKKKVYDDYINRVTAQLWNIHDLVLDMAKEKKINLVSVLYSALLGILSHSLVKDSGNENYPGTLDCKSKIVEMELYWSFSSDLFAVISQDMIAEYILATRDDLIQALGSLMALCQCMNPITRQIGTHVVYEDNSWQAAFGVELEMARSFAPTFLALSNLSKALTKYNPNALEQEIAEMKTSRALEIIGYFIKALERFFGHVDLQSDLDECVINGIVRPCVRRKVKQAALSIHIPLHRVVAGLAKTALVDLDMDSEKLAEGGGTLFWTLALEHPLRIHAFLAQVQADLWVRNGNSVKSQAILYRRHFFCYDDAFDLDIFLIQLLSLDTFLGPDYVIQMALDCFGISKWFSNSTLARFSRLNHKHIKESLVEDFLIFIITIIKERAKCGMSDRDAIVRELIHRMCVADFTHSSLVASIPRRLTNHPEFEDILKEVAVHREADTTRQGRYELKPEYWPHFDLYFPRYIPKQRQDAMERYSNYIREKKQVEGMGILPFPRLYPCHPKLAGIAPSLLGCQSLLKILFFILLTEGDIRKLSGDILIAVLHLLMLCVDELPNIEELNQITKDVIMDEVDSGEEIPVIDISSFDKIKFPSKSLDINIRHKFHFQHFGRVTSVLDRIIDIYLCIEPGFKPFVDKMLKKIAKRDVKSLSIISTRLPQYNTSASISVTSEEERNEWKKSMLDRKRAIMEQYSKKQKDFLNSSFMNFEEGTNVKSEASVDTEKENGNLETTSEDNIFTDSMEQEFKKIPIECSLCHEGELITQNSAENPIALLSLVTRSKMLHNMRHNNMNLKSADILDIKIENFKQNVAKPKRKSEEEQSTPQPGPGLSTFPNPPLNRAHKSSSANRLHTDSIIYDILPRAFANICDGETVHIESCGHHVHIKCLYRYFFVLLQKHNQRMWYEGLRIISLLEAEFLCPTCRRLCNAAVPIISSPGCIPLPIVPCSSGNLEQWTARVQLQIREGSGGMELGAKRTESPTPPNSVFTSPTASMPSSPAHSPRTSQIEIPSSPVPQSQNIEDAMDWFVRKIECEQNSVCTTTISVEPKPNACHVLWTLVTEKAGTIECESRYYEKGFVAFVQQEKIQQMMKHMRYVCHLGLTYSRKLNERSCRIRMRFLDWIWGLIFGKDTESIDNLLSHDSFSIYGRAVFLFSILSPNVDAWPLIKIFLAVRVIQSIYSLIKENRVRIDETEKDSRLGHLFAYMHSGTPEARDKLLNSENVSAASGDFHAEVVRLCSPFLKQATLVLAMLRGRFPAKECGSSTQAQWAFLCKLLNIRSNLNVLLDDPFLRQLMVNWIFHAVGRDESVHNIANVVNRIYHVQEPLPVRFISLPYLFQHAFQKIATQHCSGCLRPTFDPAVCLVCGEFICGGYRHVNIAEGEDAETEKSSLIPFLKHAQTCGAGIGVVLMIKLCLVLLIRGRRYCFWGSLYLDDHGEEDLGLKRGKPLFLNNGRLQKLLRLYTSQGIDHDTHVLDHSQQYEDGGDWE